MSDRPDDIKDLKETLDHLGSKQDRQTEILGDIRINMAKQEAVFDAHMKQDEQVYGRIVSMDHKLGEYNQLLAVHIEGVNQLRQTNALLEKKIDIHQADISARVSTLEVPHKWISTTKSAVITVSKVTAAIMALAAFAKWIGLF